MTRKSRGAKSTTCEDLLYEAMALFDVESEQCTQARGHKWDLVTEYYNQNLPKKSSTKTKLQLQEYVKNKTRRIAKKLSKGALEVN